MGVLLEFWYRGWGGGGSIFLPMKCHALRKYAIDDLSGCFKILTYSLSACSDILGIVIASFVLGFKKAGHSSTENEDISKKLQRRENVWLVLNGIRYSKQKISYCKLEYVF